MKVSKFGVLIISSLCILFLFSCQDGEYRSGTLSLNLTDAPAQQFEAVYVTIKEVWVHVGGDEEDEGNWEIVVSPNKTYNLLELRYCLRVSLGIAELQSGHYTQMRLIIADEPDDGFNLRQEVHPYANYVIDSSYDYHELKIPSGPQTGVKIVGGFDINENQTTELTLDFDASKSVVKAGNSGKWLLKPTIKVLVDTQPTLIEPDPSEWVPLVRFDGSAAGYCYPDTPSAENDGRCITTFNQDAPVYWEGQYCSSNSYKLAYWFWYGWQQECGFGTGDHNNDWEHIILNFNIDNEGVFTIESVTFFQHKGWYTRSQSFKDINVWVGKIGHGSYHNWCDGWGFLWEADYCMGGCGYWDDFRNDTYGIQWKPTNLIPLDEAKNIAGPIGDRVKNEDYCDIPSCEGSSDRVLTTAGCWQNNFTLQPISQSTSSYDAPLFFECSGSLLFPSACENSSAITNIFSVHDNDREDRVWTFGCTPLSGGSTKCEWTDYINDWDQSMDYSAPDNYFISGFSSFHSNDREDRIWKVKVCEQQGKCFTGCEWTVYLNDWDGILNLSTEGKVVAGIRSYHSNDREDRRWSFKLCDLVDCE